MSSIAAPALKASLEAARLHILGRGQDAGAGYWVLKESNGVMSNPLQWEITLLPSPEGCTEVRQVKCV